MEKENSNIFVISIVAIVAIVGMIILFSGQKAVVVQGTPVNTISEIPENSGNLAGQAYTRPEKINYNDLIKEGFEVVRETSKGVQLKNHKTNQIVNFCTDIGGNSCYGSCSAEGANCDISFCSSGGSGCGCDTSGTCNNVVSNCHYGGNSPQNNNAASEY